MAIAGMQQTPTALCGHTLPTPARFRTQRLATRTVRVRAEEQQQQQQGDGPRLSFKPSQRAGLGYTDEDSAGQQNIFAVEPRQYLSGSLTDNTSGVAPIILVAGAIGICILGLGLLLNGEDPATDGLSSLSEYSRKFAAEVGGAPPLT